MKSLPSIPGNTWRVMQPGDVNGLYQLELVCSEYDGATNITSQAEWKHRLSNLNDAKTNSIVATDILGNITAAGWIFYQEEVHEVQAFLDGRVHPNYRGYGIGGKLLSWLENQALKILNSTANGRKKVLRIMFYDRGEDAIALYEQHGYRFQFAEEELEFDLQNKLPDYPLPPGITVHTWSPENANKFYNAYRDSFSTRTTSLMEEDAWAHHFANPRDDGFQPKLSLLVTSADQAMAFAVCHTDSFQNDEKPKLVWITQMGVHAEYRRQKIGTAILSELLHRYIKAGFDYAKLSVNIDNPSAKALYEKVGFSPINRFTLYRKEVDP